MKKGDAARAGLDGFAEAKAQGLQLVAHAISQYGGKDAVSLKVAEQYIDAFANLAKKSNTILLPQNCSDAGSFVAQALSIYNNLSEQKNIAP